MNKQAIRIFLAKYCKMFMFYILNINEFSQKEKPFLMPGLREEERKYRVTHHQVLVSWMLIRRQLKARTISLHLIQVLSTLKVTKKLKTSTKLHAFQASVNPIYRHLLILCTIVDLQNLRQKILQELHNSLSLVMFVWSIKMLLSYLFLMEFSQLLHNNKELDLDVILLWMILHRLIINRQSLQKEESLWRILRIYSDRSVHLKC